MFHFTKFIYHDTAILQHQSSSKPRGTREHSCQHQWRLSQCMARWYSNLHYKLQGCTRTYSADSGWQVRRKASCQVRNDLRHSDAMVISHQSSRQVGRTDSNRQMWEEKTAGEYLLSPSIYFGQSHYGSVQFIHWKTHRNYKTVIGGVHTSYYLDYTGMVKPLNLSTQAGLLRNTNYFYFSRKIRSLQNYIILII